MLKVGGDSAEDFFKKQLGGVDAPQAVINELINNISSSFANRQTSEEIRGDVKGALEKFSSEIAKGAAPALQGLQTAVNDAAQGIINAATEYVAAQDRVNNNLFNLAQARASNQVALAGINNRTLTAQQLSRISDAPIQQLAGTTDPDTILKQITQRQKLQDNIQARLRSGQGDPLRLNAALASNQSAINRLTQGLTKLSQDTQALTNVQNELAKIESDRQKERSFVEGFAFSDTQGRVRQNQAAQQLLASGLLSGQNRGLSGTQLRESVQFARNAVDAGVASGSITQELADEINARIDRGIAQTPGLGRLGQRFIQSEGRRGTREDALRKFALDAAKRQEDALKAIAELSQKPLEEIRKTIQEEFEAQTQEIRNIATGNFVGRNLGGKIPGGGPNRDTVPAMLTRGEFVVNRAATQANLPLLHAINSGMFTGFNTGGDTQELLRRFQAAGIIPGGQLTTSEFSAQVNAAQIIAVDPRRKEREASIQSRREARLARLRDFRKRRAGGRGPNFLAQQRQDRRQAFLSQQNARAFAFAGIGDGGLGISNRTSPSSALRKLSKLPNSPDVRAARTFYKRAKNFFARPGNQRIERALKKN